MNTHYISYLPLSQSYLQPNPEFDPLFPKITLFTYLYLLFLGHSPTYNLTPGFGPLRDI